ncbi:MAG: glycosyltransferase family 4 protein [Candidatus Buchananbacteria bacterium]
MKVLIISLAYLPFVGGAELAVKDITDRISDIDFDLVTVNLDGRQPEQEKIGRVNVYRVGHSFLSKYFFPIIGYQKADALLQENKYDVVWAIMANQSGIIASRLKKNNPELKYFLTLQEGDSLLRIWSRTWFMRPLYKNIYRRADFIQAISNFLAQRAKKYGFSKSMEIIPNGVNLTNFAKEFSDETMAELKKDLGISQDEKVVTTISRLVYKNGIDTLIKAIKDLPIKVMIIGCGRLETNLKALAQEIGVKHKVLFIGYVNQRDLPRYLKVSDIFVRTSRSEGLGSAFLESMAAGVPVIGTKIGGIPDFLQANKTGLFAEVGNPRDLALKIKQYLDEPKLYETIKNNGRDLVMKNYDWQPIAEKIKSIFYQL